MHNHCTQKPKLTTLLLTLCLFITQTIQSLQETPNPSKFPLPVKGYPGYIDIDTDGSAFYWLFRKDSSCKLSNKDPLIIYIPGGPGLAIIDVLFYGSGPYKFLNQEKVIKNPYSWTKHANMLFIDWPLGSGFSTFNDSSKLSH